MSQKVTIFMFLLLVLLMVSSLLAQEPKPIVTPVFIDSSVYNGIYRGVQTQFFCEPTTGNLICAWYRYYGSSNPDPRRITAAVSTDGGQTWTIHENINLGVGAEMNARYATCWGTSTTPIVAYGDRNPGGSDRDTRPIVAYDVLGWNGGLFENLFVDDAGTPDTALYVRYVSFSTAPDNENHWALGGYHNAAPGEAYYYYYSTNAGQSWSRPRVPMSAVESDSNNSNYVPDLSSTGIGVCLGPNNTVMVSGLGQWLTGDDEIWRLLYATSKDMGNTWDPVAAIPGTETITFSNDDSYRQYSAPIVDQAGNWHIFGLGRDSTEYNLYEFPEPYRGYDFRFDGSTWTINKFAFPHTFENGLVAWGDFPPDQERYNMNDPAIGPDGTLYYAYTDIVDTTGAMGDVAKFNHHIMVMFSEDNGENWEGPVSVLEEWSGHSPNGMARYATDKLHFVYRKTNETRAEEFYYLGVPTDTIKARATRVENKIRKIMPDEFSLHQNYPNPFNPTTNITFDLKEPVHVTLKIYNTMGQEVATLIDEPMTAGFKGITWYAGDLPSGAYFYQLKAGNHTETKRMILSK